MGRCSTPCPTRRLPLWDKESVSLSHHRASQKKAPGAALREVYLGRPQRGRREGGKEGGREGEAQLQRLHEGSEVFGRTVGGGKIWEGLKELLRREEEGEEEEVGEGEEEKEEGEEEKEEGEGEEEEERDRL
ncbi:hypothetical protein NSK_006193 [Nannochloropsis salina CCMP1776]|uniref:Uncharacterized protein n=1 Tax=Nannochloropsis salina CCMP1776 TaxID=1027361 RepID=A0A4D9CYQ0_9STRA|nr:hypothetical protein NSK_006193 [Nannochloropsis salina CCMP1776]|eukprot:TFJ82515.1 hypothetical protein NSK_006193 [Nannochloropsis salina CCMP1776]